MKGGIVTWINGRGNTQTRSFEWLPDALSFTAKLDDRIGRGTCGGYTLTECDTVPTVCPKCGSRHLEEHGTEPGDHNWWFCRECGWQDDVYELGAMVHNEPEEVIA